GDHLCLAALLGADAWIRAWRIDEAKHRHLILGRHAHLQDRLAVTLRMRAAIKTLLAFLERLAFLMADDHHFVFVQLGEAGADGAVVAERLVAMQFDKLIEDQVEVVGHLRTIRMPRYLNRIPCVELAVDALLFFGELASQSTKRLGGLRRVVARSFE